MGIMAANAAMAAGLIGERAKAFLTAVLPSHDQFAGGPLAPEPARPGDTLLHPIIVPERRSGAAVDGPASTTPTESITAICGQTTPAVHRGQRRKLM